MKTLFYTLVFIISFSFNCDAQSGIVVNYQDDLGTATLQFDGTVNGKYSYKNNPIGITLSWSSSNNRWEIRFDFGGLTFYSNEETTTNPPNLTVGNWQDATGGGATLIALSGSGTTGSLLPIQLVSFSDNLVGNTRYLNWSTATEQNNQKFEIEQSTDGLHFNKIGEVQGSGSTSKPQQYRFDLQNFLNTNISFFRLKQIDFDGSFSYSHILSVSKKEQSSFVFPNPSTNGTVYLSYQQSRETNENMISILDNTGKIIRQIENTSPKGNHLLNIDVSGLNSGMYFIQLKENNQVFSHKVIVK